MDREGGALGTLDAGLTVGGRADEWSATGFAYIALDVDGTLVRDTPVPDRRTLAAIERLAGSGAHVGLSTGRMAASTDAILRTGVFTGPHVFNNGAAVLDGSGNDLAVLGLTDGDVEAVLRLGRDHDDVWVEIYLSDRYLVDRVDDRSGLHADLLGVAPSGRIVDASDLAGRPAVKAVVVCTSPAAARRTIDAVVELGLAAGPAGSPATPGLRFINITRSGVDKGSGVETAARHLGLHLGSVVSVGDETNDIPALARSGTAIAMGGASDEVIASAHLVAPSFEGSGAAVALEWLGRRLTG